MLHCLVSLYIFSAGNTCVKICGFFVWLFTVSWVSHDEKSTLVAAFCGKSGRSFDTCSVRHGSTSCHKFSCFSGKYKLFFLNSHSLSKPILISKPQLGS